MTLYVMQAWVCDQDQDRERFALKLSLIVECSKKDGDMAPRIETSAFELKQTFIENSLLLPN